MKTPKQELIHSVWDIQQKNYSQRNVKGDPVFVSQMMADLFCPGPSYFYIVDFSNRQVSHVSPTVVDILGIRSEGFSFDKLLSLVHPDDTKHVINCEETIIDFLFNKIKPEQLPKGLEKNNLPI